MNLIGTYSYVHALGGALRSGSTPGSMKFLDTIMESRAATVNNKLRAFIIDGHSDLKSRLSSVQWVGVVLRQRSSPYNAVNRFGPM